MKKITDLIGNVKIPRMKKLFRMMKLTSFFLLISVVSVLAGKTYSQTKTLTLILGKTTVKEVLSEIEDQSGLYFMYNSKYVDVDREISLNAANQKLEAVLDLLFAGTNVNYTMKDKIIVLSTPALNEQSSSQQKSVFGKVTDSSGSPLPGVSVIVKGTTTGTVTDFDGKFTLANVPGDATLVFSFVGMKTQEIAVAGTTSINTTMTEEMIGIDEVVAIGYGTMKKSDLTGSVSQVKAEDIAAYPSVGLLQSLQGRAAGVQIQSNNGGEPGASMKVRIRGSTSINSSSDPLYVVDGFPGATMPPSEDIESVEVLKDASATAIYGSRGASGVILITTKKGKEGKTKIELNTSYSIQKEIRRLDLLDKDEFTDYINEVNPGYFQNALVGSGTDWQNEVLQTGNIQNHQLSFSGGNSNLKYYVSGILYDQDGILKKSGFKRYSLTSNLNIKATERIDVGINLFAGRTTSKGIPTQEIRQSSGVIASAYQAAPTLPVYDEDGNYTVSTLADPSDNPVAIMNEYREENLSDILQANFFGEYKLLPELAFRVTLGANVINSRNGSYSSSKLTGNDSGKATMGTSKSTHLINENYLTYIKKIGVHELGLMGGYSYQSSEYEGLSALNRTFLTDAFLWWDMDGGSDFSAPSSYLTKTELSSFYGRVNYKLLDKYLITLNARYDGSSRFAKNNKWAFFPSGAIAWNVAEESFMDNLPQISQLKLRGSYGVTGNQAIGAYQSLAKLESVHSIQNSAIVNAVVPSAVANDNLTWESTAQTDVGLDLGLFDQKILLVMDYYYKKTTDLLFNMPLPEYSGYGSMLKNIGSLQNQGIEITLSTQNVNRKLKWTTDLNFSLNRNKVLDLPDGNDVPYGIGTFIEFEYTNILREGEPVGVFYGHVYDGVIQEGEDILPGNFKQYPGGEKFKDMDGNKKIDGNDRVIIGDPNPDFIYGINNTFEYKGFDLNFFIQGSQGNDLFSMTLAELEQLKGNSNATTEALKRWSPTNTDTDVPKASTTRSLRSSSRWIFDGSFVRLKNISLGYNLPKSIIHSIGLENARIYISGQNILTLSKFRGYDPEVNYNSEGTTNSNRNLGYDFASYPNAKSYTMGLKLTF